MSRQFASAYRVVILAFVFYVVSLYNVSAQTKEYNPDISFAKIILDDPNSFDIVLGDIKQYHNNDSMRICHGYVFINDSLNQYIRFVWFPGDGYDNFSRIEVGYMKDLLPEQYIYHKKFIHFASESGISMVSRREH